MITEQDLLEAIAECQGQRNPTSNTCIKLAAYYTILNNMNPQRPEPELSMPVYSFAGEPPKNIIEYDSGTEFSDIVNGMNQDDFLDVMDELMLTLKAINPRLYDGVLRKLQ